MNELGDYCISELYIDNFKVFHDFRIIFSDPITAIVGDNASGKSSILQAIAFLKYCCTSTTDTYMKDRGVKVDDLVSKVSPKLKKNITFRVNFINRLKVIDSLEWEIILSIEKSKNKIVLNAESVRTSKEENLLLQYGMKNGYRFNEKHSDLEAIALGSYSSSQIAFIDEKHSTQFPHLYAIKKFFMESEPLDLLTPKNMRKSARGQERSLGDSGEKLPNLIYKLNSEEKDQLLTSLNKVLPNMASVRSVRSGSGKAGWAHLEITEKFKEHPITVQAGGISDGTLRLVALFALPFLKKRGGCILLDEVEDGINAENLQVLLEILRRYAEENHQQIIMTTHSTVLLDYLKPEEIRCLYRRSDGCAECVAFEDLSDVKEKLSYLYPGEIILNGGKHLFREQGDTIHD